MARIVRKRKPDPPPTTPLAAAMEKHLEALQAQNYSPFTVKNRRVHLGYFVQWCRDRGITEPTEVTRPILEHYQRHLFQYRKKNGEALSFRSQHARLMPLRVWFRWLARQHYLLHNPVLVESRFVLVGTEVQICQIILCLDPSGFKRRSSQECFPGKIVFSLPEKMYSKVVVCHVACRRIPDNPLIKPHR